MDKRYQVFVSSTYEDLQEERQEVMHALLELDCIPSGMELFPAANEDQWTLIQRVIDDCDYYVVIFGGRYGSTDSSGLSYTEKEYRYAVKTGKPVIGFLHKDPGSLLAKKSEQAEIKKEKLGKFRELVGQKMCQFWDGPSDLGLKVSRSLIKLIKQHPAVGWVRADQLPSDDVDQELLSLRKKVEELQLQLANSQTEAPKGTESLAQGDDRFELTFSFQAADEYGINSVIYRATQALTWNEIFYVVSPRMIDEGAERQLAVDPASLVESKARKRLQEQLEGKHIGLFNIEADPFQTILVQLKALGLVAKSIRNRSVKDTNSYWKLTPYGDSVMTRLRAIRRDEEKADERSTGTSN